MATGIHRFALVGAQGVGKTSAMQVLGRALGEDGLSVGGVLQPARHRGGVRVGYDLLDPSDGGRFAMATRKDSFGPGELSYGFDEGCWAWASERIAHARRSADVLVVDELGKLEARGAGHLPALQGTVGEELCGVWVLGVRDLALDAVVEALGPFEYVVLIDGSGEGLAELRRRIHVRYR